MESNKVKVLLTGSHVLVLEGLNRILKDDENLEVWAWQNILMKQYNGLIYFNRM